VTTATGAEALTAADADLRLPRRLLTRMKAETTLLPLVLLPLILIAIDAGVTDEFALGSASVDYLYDIVGGLTIGIVVGFVGLWARRSTPEGPPQIAVSFAIPFLAGLAGHAATASVIAAIIAAGFVIEAFYSGRVVGRPYSAGTQEIGRAFWLQTTLILAGSLSFIVGLSIPTAVEDVDVATAPMIAYVAAALALVTALRFAIGYATAGYGRDAARVPRAKEGLVLAWGGTRTPLAFVIALLVPPVAASGAPFPDRDLILVFTAALVLSSVLIQGGTLGLLLRALGLSGDDGVRREEQAARRVLAQVGDRRDAAFEAERAALVRLYDADEIGEETMLRLRQEIDLAASGLPRTERAVDG
jgi:monovalent cation/hydrogen antiporter